MSIQFELRRLLFTGAIFTWGLAYAGAEPANTTESTLTNSPLAISHGPFLQAPSQTGVTISWATTRKTVSSVEYRPASSKQWLTNFPTRHGLVDANETYHNVPLTDLKPGVQYVYRVVSREIVSFLPSAVTFGETITSPEYRFTTLDRQKSAFSFVVVNDRHEHTDALRSSWASVDWKDVDLAFLNGDMVYATRDEMQLYTVVIDPCAEFLNQTTPLVYVRGNHETRGYFARHLLEYFPTDSGRYYYTFQHGPVLFLVLDSGEDKVDDHPKYFGLTVFGKYMEMQVRWLKAEIEKPAFQAAKFRVCFMHIPPAGSGGSVPRRWLGENVVPLLNKSKVDLLLCGHTHRYAVQPAGTDGFNFPVVTGGTQTVIRCDVSPDGIRTTSTSLAGPPLPQLPPIRAAEVRRSVISLDSNKH